MLRCPFSDNYQQARSKRAQTVASAQSLQEVEYAHSLNPQNRSSVANSNSLRPMHGWYALLKSPIRGHAWSFVELSVMLTSATAPVYRGELLVYCK